VNRPADPSASGASILIAAGGTGGHIFPGLALADAILADQPSARVAFVGTPRGLESSLIPKAGYQLHLVDMVPVANANKLRVPLAFAKSIGQARRLLKHHDADVAVGMGGYASAPLIVAARTKRIPSLIHESGAILGRANALAARFTPNVAYAFERTEGKLPSSVTPRVVGMPLGPQFATFDRDALRAEARRSFGIEEGKVALFVMGGSLGAAHLNELAVELAGRWKGRDDVAIVIKAGRDHGEKVEAALDRNGGSAIARCISFFDRMDFAYAAADLGLCRAGAGTVGEIAVTGLPSILVPYPHAIDDHQTLNAGALVRAGGALLIPDRDLVVDRVQDTVEELLFSPARLKEMSEAARSVAYPRAAEHLAQWVLSLRGDRVTRDDG
jgi:UDP-N-acetylglucosamine--N-acetylmuramyl-(pentapeptide) pyrophosphoryl-undecaprenol N-acetylglucosamine transferase